MLKLTQERRRRPMTALSAIRRRIRQLGPYQSLMLLLLPLLLVEPLKLVALVVAGKGHWLARNRNDYWSIRNQSSLHGTTFSSAQTEAANDEMVREGLGFVFCVS
jgi:hypothetical protein